MNCTVRSFNSKLVRLKGAFAASTYWAVEIAFQFQTGAIKSSGNARSHASADMFQFQTGAIKRCNVCRQNPRPERFQFQTGAIKRQVLQLRPLTLILFQFQTGAIKSKSCESCKSCSFFSFNSKLVRLKGYTRGTNMAQEILFQFQTGAIKRQALGGWLPCVMHVSIPNWCD